MANYDEYMEKMQRIAAKIPLIKNLIRVAIAIICVAGIWGMVILYRIGSFTEEITCSDITYGEELTYHSLAYKSEVSYYFAKEGSDEWQSGEPYRAGKYAVKAVTKTFWNTTKESYCEFCINKRELQVSYNEIEVKYGQEPVPDVVFKNLAAGDSVSIKQSPAYTLPETYGDGFFAKVEISDLIILNSKNEDVTDCYYVVSEEGRFTVLEVVEPEEPEEPEKPEEPECEGGCEKEQHDGGDIKKEKEITEETSEETDEETASENESESDFSDGEGLKSGLEQGSDKETWQQSTEGENNISPDRNQEDIPYESRNLDYNQWDHSYIKAAEKFDTGVSKKSPISGDQSEILFSVLSGKTTRLLLKSTSLDQYITTGRWKSTIDLGYIYRNVSGGNPWIWVGKQIERNDIDTFSVSIKENGRQNITTLIPCYPTKDVSSFSDVVNNYGNSNDLAETFEFTVANADAEDIINYPVRNHIEPEAGYRKFVYKYYLDVDKKEAEVLRKLAGEAGIRSDSETVIKDVEEYVKNSAVYNMSYKAYPTDKDPVIYFLTVAKEGICQHFASAATLMYRALGIPARYVQGYAVNCEADEWTYVTAESAHAWVEVYMDEIGWVAVDPTAPILGGSYDGQDLSIEFEAGVTERGKVELRMTNVMKYFDGKPFESDLYDVLSGGFIEGDTFFCRGSAKETYAGIYTNECTDYYVLDSDGKVVTSEYDITAISGVMNIQPIHLDYQDDRDIILTEKIEQCDLSEYKWNAGDWKLVPYLRNTNKYFEINDGILIGTRANTLWADFKYDNADYNNDGIYEVVESEIMIPISILSFSNVNVVGDTYTGNPGSREPYIITDYTGQEYNLLRVEMGTKSKSYDGEPLTGDYVTIIEGALYPGDRIVASGYSRLDYVGTIPNKCANLKVIDANGKDVTKNYYIFVYDGTLTIETNHTAEENIKYSMNMWKSVKVSDVFAAYNPDYQEGEADILNDRISIKNGALVARKPGKTSIRKHICEDLNGDNIPEYEYDVCVEINIRIPILIWLLSIGCVVLVARSIKKARSTR